VVVSSRKGKRASKPTRYFKKHNLNQQTINSKLRNRKRARKQWETALPGEGGFRRGEQREFREKGVKVGKSSGEKRGEELIRVKLGKGECGTLRKTHKKRKRSPGERIHKIKKKIVGRTQKVENLGVVQATGEGNPKDPRRT